MASPVGFEPAERPRNDAGAEGSWTYRYMVARMDDLDAPNLPHMP